MKENIEKADLFVICATPRYIQKDMKTGNISYGLSEMVFVETGMAYANNKPVIVFVKEGTDTGRFIPGITQHIILKEDCSDYPEKKHLISSLINRVLQIIFPIKKEVTTNLIEILFKLLIGGLAIYGGYNIIKNTISKEE